MKLQIAFLFLLSPLRFLIMADSPPPDATTGAEPSILEPDTPDTEYSVLLFAGLKDAVQSAQITVHVARPNPATLNPATVKDLMDACAVQHPRLARWLPYVRVAVNREYSGLSDTIRASDEIAILPPVAGGAA